MWLSIENVNSSLRVLRDKGFITSENKIESEYFIILDNFFEIMEKIHEEAESNPEILRNAPHNTPVKRLDAVIAARKPVLHD